ncbi:MAG TPA: penicillin-binding transpeptidase domain-containing protein [Verrucomicrobiales bacterium]|nr:penicillin-binding transpeptidase domain-containing protein [Verrucomicrobiales bacterium]
MKRHFPLFAAVLAGFWIPQRLPAQDPIDPGPEIETGEISDPKVTPTWETQKQARTVELVLPAPRGVIVDRHGRPLAQNRVAYQPALRFPVDRVLAASEILAFAQSRIARVNELLGSAWSVDDADISKHYENRRWVPMTFGDILTDTAVSVLKEHPENGVELHASYLRHYPRKAFAPHVLGYVRRSGGPPTGPLSSADPYYDHYAGVLGLELSFNDELRGVDGKLNLLFNSRGEKTAEEILVRPRQGHTVVTTLDADMQALAEDALKRQVRRGALVVVDVRTGEILALASWPVWDLNDFIPRITSDRFEKLKNDPREPFFPSAFQGTYPPASTFKVVMCLGMLRSGLAPDRKFNCAPAIRYGRIAFPNWHSGHEGAMGMRMAIARSCNTYFYQAGQVAGSGPLIEQALLMGFGKPTGVPLGGESSGLVPTNSYMINQTGREMTSGHIANFVIGQGYTQATPLQVAQAMAGIGNGQVVPHAHLIKQIQDIDNSVLQAFSPNPAGSLNINPDLLDHVRKGMIDVVHSGHGTGKGGYVSGVKMAAKTGTGQWIKAKRQNVAWFSGYLPADAPRFAFAALYEGSPGQGLSGGAQAAPIVRRFFSDLYSKKGAPIWTEAGGGITSGGSSNTESDESSSSANQRPPSSKPPSPEPVPQAKPVEEAPKKRGLFNRLRGIFGRRS